LPVNGIKTPIRTGSAAQAAPAAVSNAASSAAMTSRAVSIVEVPPPGFFRGPGAEHIAV
jgi:hypothetical protein